jgi:hypothetical protein
MNRSNQFRKLSIAERDMRIYISGYEIARARSIGACEAALIWLGNNKPVTYLHLFQHDLNWFLWAAGRNLIPRPILLAAARILEYQAAKIRRMR